MNINTDTKRRLTSLTLVALLVTSLVAMPFAAGSDRGTARAAPSAEAPATQTTTPSLETTFATTEEHVLFEDDFENDSIDTGVPDSWEAVTDPANNGYTRNADTERISDNTSYSGDKSYYIAESSNDNVIYTRPQAQPLNNKSTKNVSVALFEPGGGANDGSKDYTTIGLFEGTGDVPSVNVGVREESNGTELGYFDSTGSFVVLADNFTTDQWTKVGIYDVDPATNTFSLSWAASTSVGKQTGLEMRSSMSEGYNSTILGIDGDGYVDDFKISNQSVFNQISGTAVDQNGQPLPENTTVTAWGVAEPALSSTDAQEMEREAEKLLSELDDPTPEQWNKDLDPRKDVAGDASSTYVVAHTGSDWGSGLRIRGDSELGNPHLQLPAHEKVVLSLWDPSSSGFFDNPIDKSLPGRTTSGTIIVEQLSPTGEVLNSKTQYETSSYRKVDRIGGGKDHEAAAIDLPPGYYRIYPESTGFGAGGYVISVGSAEQRLNALSSEMRDSANNRIQRSKAIQNRMEGLEIVRKTTTTDANGKFSVNLPENVVTAKINTLRADGKILQNAKDPSLENLRKARATGSYNGSVILPNPTAKTVEPPADGVVVKGFRSPSVPYGNVSDWGDLLEHLEQQRMNETIAEMESRWNQRLNETERSTLVSQYKGLKPLVQTAPGAEQSYLNDSTFDSVQLAEDLSTQELRTEIPLMQQALYNQKPINIEPPEQPESPNGDALSAEFSIPESVDKDAIDVRVHWSDGTVENVPKKHWSIQNTGLFGDTKQVSISFPIDENDPPQGTLAVQAANGDGAGESRVPITNPNFEGAIPAVPAVDLSTMSPGQNDRVSLTLRPESGTGFGELVSIDALDPQGSAVASNVTGPKGGWVDTNGQGVHRVFVTYRNDAGQQFQRVVSVRALEQSRSNPPTLRVSKGATGTFAIVGDGLDSARVEKDNNQVTIGAIAPPDDVPGRVTVKPGAVIDSETTSLDVNVLLGDPQTSVDSRVSVNVHLDSLSENALLWRGSPSVAGQPITWNGETHYGEVQQPSEQTDKAVIRTYTDENGEVELTINRESGPSRWSAAATHRAARIAYNLPTGWVPSFGTVGLIGLAGVARRRRPGTFSLR